MSQVAAVILAAGLSSRMGGDNKLLADLNGRPVLRHTVENVLASRARLVVVVTGHQADQVQDVIQDLPVTICFNPDFADGMATSLCTGIAALSEDVSGALILLGDMPLIGGDIIDALIEAFEARSSQTIAVPVIGGKRGHPVLWGRGHFGALLQLSGDHGARALLVERAGDVIECQVSDAGIFEDTDTPDALEHLRSGLNR